MPVSHQRLRSSNSEWWQSGCAISKGDPCQRLIQMLQSRESPLLASAAEIVPANYFAPLDLEAIYGRNASIEVDLGCGDGSFLAEIAAANPGTDFLGIERLPGRIRSTQRKITERGLTNARVLLIETSYAVQRMLPASSVTQFYLMFPDPWPKRRHWSRRVVTKDFFASVHRALVPHGALRIATDQIDYFREIERLARESTEFVINSDPEPPAARSTFEKRFSLSEIYRLRLLRASAVT
jgi:tRNA (guanine-N7-)-methyltransferase